MNHSRVLVAVVDDDASVRESLRDLLNELGFAVRIFASAEAFLGSEYVADARCVIADVAMPGMSGFDLDHALQHRGFRIPTIFMTAGPSDGNRAPSRASRANADLFKPFSEKALLDAIEAALGHR